MKACLYLVQSKPCLLKTTLYLLGSTTIWKHVCILYRVNWFTKNYTVPPGKYHHMKACLYLVQSKPCLLKTTLYLLGSTTIWKLVCILYRVNWFTKNYTVPTGKYHHMKACLYLVQNKPGLLKTTVYLLGSTTIWKPVCIMYRIKLVY